MPPIIPIPTDIPENSSVEENGFVDSVNGMSDSESPTEEDNSSYEGYEPLSQDPDTFLDNQCVEEEAISSENELNAVGVNISSHPSLLLSPAETHEITSTNALKAEDFKMDEEHIETIKSVMKGITLPSSNLPQWATVVPEEEWKTNLLSEMLLKKHEENANNKNYCKPNSVKNTTDMQNDVPR